MRLLLDPEDEHLRVEATQDVHGYYRVGSRAIHSILCPANSGQHTDHINGDIGDNRKANLRAVTALENSRNRASAPLATSKSPYLGVTRSTRSTSWEAQIEHFGKRIHLGSFPTAEQANVARLLKERELWGIQPRRLTAFHSAGIVPSVSSQEAA